MYTYYIYNILCQYVMYDSDDIEPIYIFIFKYEYIITRLMEWSSKLSNE